MESLAHLVICISLLFSICSRRFLPRKISPRYAAVGPYATTLHTWRARLIAAVAKLPVGALRPDHMAGRLAERGAPHAVTMPMGASCPRRAPRRQPTACDDIPRHPQLKTFGVLIDHHIADMCVVGRPPHQSLAAMPIVPNRDAANAKIDQNTSTSKFVFFHLGIVGSCAHALAECKRLHGTDVSSYIQSETDSLCEYCAHATCCTRRYVLPFRGGRSHSRRSSC